jgi:hypothetical protein
MSAPSRQRVVPLGEDLLHPLHNSGKLKPVLGLDVETNPVGLNAEAPDLEGETQHGFPEHPVKQGDGPGLAEERLPVIDAGAHFIPDPLGKLT